MSRVKHNQKHVNATHYGGSVTGPSKLVRVHTKNEDYHKASTLSDWLFMKYDMKYSTYRNKSQNRRAELVEEYMQDTGNESPAQKNLRKRAEKIAEDGFETREDVYELLRSIGVPFDPMGEPIGIGDD